MEILHLTFKSYCTRIFYPTVTNVANVDLICTEYTHETLNGATLSTIVDAGGIRWATIFRKQNCCIRADTGTVDAWSIHFHR